MARALEEETRTRPRERLPVPAGGVRHGHPVRGLGDPAIVKTKGESTRRSPQRSALRCTLDNIVDQVDQKSLAMSATRDLAHDVASDIRKATDRYQKTGDALVTYANELERTQNDSRYPARRIAEIEAALVTARYTARVRRDEYLDAVRSGDDAAIETARERRDTADGTVTSLETSLATHQQSGRPPGEGRGRGRRGHSSGHRGQGRRGPQRRLLGPARRRRGRPQVICDIAAILSIFLSGSLCSGRSSWCSPRSARSAIVDAASSSPGRGRLRRLLLAVVVESSRSTVATIGMAAQRIRFSMTCGPGHGHLGARPPLGAQTAYHSALNAYPRRSPGLPQGLRVAVRALDDLSMRTFTQATGFRGNRRRFGSRRSSGRTTLQPQVAVQVRLRRRGRVLPVDQVRRALRRGCATRPTWSSSSRACTRCTTGRSGVALTGAITGGDCSAASTRGRRLSGPVGRRWWREARRPPHGATSWPCADSSSCPSSCPQAGSRSP